MLERGFEDDDIIKIVNISPQTLAQLKTSSNLCGIDGNEKPSCTPENVSLLNPNGLSHVQTVDPAASKSLGTLIVIQQ